MPSAPVAAYGGDPRRLWLGMPAAMALAEAGEADRALDLLERLQPRGVQIHLPLRTNGFDPLRTNPRFVRLFRRDRAAGTSRSERSPRGDGARRRAPPPCRLCNWLLEKPVSRRHAAAVLHAHRAPRGRSRAHTVAVMYLDNQSRDTSDAYLADGLTEEITTKLGQIGRLAVTSNTTMRRYRNGTTEPAQLGRELRVAQLVSGSIRRAGHRIRVNVELLRARDGVQLWADAYDRTDADLLAIEEDVARAVASAIAGRLLPGEQATLAARPTQNPEAYDHLLRGQLLHRPTHTGRGPARPGRIPGRGGPRPDLCAGVRAHRPVLRAVRGLGLALPGCLRGQPDRPGSRRWGPGAAARFPVHRRLDGAGLHGRVPPPGPRSRGRCRRSRERSSSIPRTPRRTTSTAAS